MPLTPDVGRQLIKEHTLRALVTQLSDGCEVGHHLASPHRTWLVGITTESRAFNSSHLVVSKGVTNSLRLQSAGEQSLASLRDERPINFKQRQRKLVACVLCVHSVLSISRHSWTASLVAGMRLTMRASFSVRDGRGLGIRGS